jgi:antitoxin (DNA-binding transcriptional repressor) of toxin-antitoxin stability system
MKSVSIRELHQSTGKIVRSVVEEPAVVTDQGRPKAIIRPFDAKDLPGRSLPPGHWRSQPRPHLDGDSTIAVSKDRDRQ